jgi:hypothetical protein
MALTLEPAAGDAPEAAAPLRVTVELDSMFAAWLTARAAAHGEEPGEHAATILRAYWAHHDQWRHQQGAAATRPVAR